MDKSDADRILLARGWLSRQAKSFQIAVLRRARLLFFEKGEHAFNVGDPPGGIYGVTQGAFALEVTTVHTEARLAHIVRQGVWFGTRPVHTGNPRALTFRALEPSAALYVPIAALNEVAAADRSTFRRLAALSEENMIGAIHVVSDLLLRSSDRRIAAILLRISGITTLDPLPPPPTGVHVTQTELGELANVSRDVVNRVLGRLENQGFISVGHSRIRILDSDSLLAFAYAEGN